MHSWGRAACKISLKAPEFTVVAGQKDYHLKTKPLEKYCTVPASKSFWLTFAANH